MVLKVGFYDTAQLNLPPSDSCKWPYISGPNVDPEEKGQSGVCVSWETMYALAQQANAPPRLMYGVQTYDRLIK